jgi:hypothetical protein
MAPLYQTNLKVDVVPIFATYVVPNGRLVSVYTSRNRPLEEMGQALHVSSLLEGPRTTLYREINLRMKSGHRHDNTNKIKEYNYKR